MTAAAKTLNPLTPPSRTVLCYHCARNCTVSVHAMSSSCPHCHRQLAIADIVVRSRHWGSRLQTCGKILLDHKADVRVNLLTAGAGVEIHGSLRGKVVSFGPVTLGETAVINGDLQAPAVFVAPGATILGGTFAISPVPKAP